MGGKGRKPSDKKPTASSGKRRKGAPSVTEFLSKISSGQRAAAPAKGLLGEVSREALIAAGRADPEHVEFIDGFDVDLTSLEDGEPVMPRRTARIPVSATVEVRGVFGLEEQRLSNASLTGVFIETASPLDVGDAVEIAFPRPGGRKLKVQGRVRWVTPFGGLKDARPGMGVELFGVDADKREVLAELISRRR